MNPPGFFLRLAISFFVAGLLPYEASGQTSPPNALISGELSNLIQQRISASGAIGGILAVYSPGQWYWSGGFGHTGVGPGALAAQPSFSYRAGSMTKMLVAAALLKLQEQQLVDLDQPITLYLSASVTGSISHASQITVRHLLQHRSGIKEFTQNPQYLATLAANGLGHAFSPVQLVQYGALQGAAFAPGAAFLYSNTNYVLAALIIQQAAAQPYEQVIQQFFLTPLGLNNTYFPTQNTLFAPAMGCFADLNGDHILEDLSSFHPSSAFGSGGIATTLSDAIRWRQALEQGLAISTASLQQMKAFAATGNSGFEYGLGIQRWSFNGVDLEGHTGNIFNSSDIQYAPQLGVYFAFNVTNFDFLQDSMRIPLYQLLYPYLDSCIRFLPVLNRSDTVYLNAGDQDLLQTHAGTGYTYTWFRNGQALPGTNQPAFAVSAPGKYAVEVIDGWSCAKRSATVTYLACPLGEADLSASSGSDRICTGERVTVSTASGMSVTWTDENGQLLTPDGPSYTFFMVSDRVIQVFGTDARGCRQRDTLVLTALPLPVADLGPDLARAAGSMVTLTAGTPGDTVNWYNSLVGGLALANSPSYEFLLGAESLTVWVEIISPFGCRAVDTIRIESTTGVENWPGSPPSLFPNPTSGTFSLSFSQPLAHAALIDLTDVYGRTLYQELLPPGSAAYVLNQEERLAPGLYLARIRTGENAWTGRVVIRP